MPRSKFATKAYGPTKPKICENQQLPPGTLAPGPGAHNAAHFLLVVADTYGLSQPVTGTATLTRTGDPTQYTGTAFIGDYSVTITLDAVGPNFAPAVEYSVNRQGTFVTRGLCGAPAPRTIDPYDSGILLIGCRTVHGQQMIRIVARD